MRVAGTASAIFLRRPVIRRLCSGSDIEDADPCVGNAWSRLSSASGVPLSRVTSSCRARLSSINIWLSRTHGQVTISRGFREIGEPPNALK